MIHVSITDAKNRLSAFIDKVKAGETVVITDRGRPVARLESAVHDVEGDDDGRLSRLERQGLLRRGKVVKIPPEILQPPPKLKRGINAVQILVDERDER